MEIWSTFVELTDFPLDKDFMATHIDNVVDQRVRGAPRVEAAAVAPAAGAILRRPKIVEDRLEHFHLCNTEQGHGFERSKIYTVFPATLLDFFLTDAF